jgi:hypothetical protein
LGQLPRQVIKVGLYVGLDPLAVALLGIDQVDGHATREAVICVDPYLSLPGHGPELVRDVERQPGRELAGLAQIVLELVAQVGAQSP